MVTLCVDAHREMGRGHLCCGLSRNTLSCQRLGLCMWLPWLSWHRATTPVMGNWLHCLIKSKYHFSCTINVFFRKHLRLLKVIINTRSEFTPSSWGLAVLVAITPMSFLCFSHVSHLASHLACSMRAHCPGQQPLCMLAPHVMQWKPDPWQGPYMPPERKQQSHLGKKKSPCIDIKY